MTLLIVVMGLLAVSAAQASAPSGFYEARVLEPAASFVAGKPATVWCALTRADYNVWREAQGAGGRDSGAFTYFGQPESWMSTGLCQVLRQRLRGVRVDIYELAGAASALVHESIHMRGVRDEGETECQAMHELPRVAVKFFGFKPGKQLRALMAEAWAYHRTLPPAYQTVC